MANKIQIKHGSGVPGPGKLSSFELGYATQTGQLYISTDGSNILGITPSSHSHTWAEVTGKPTVFNSNAIQVPDTRNIVSVPQDLLAKAVTAEFKSNSSVGNPPVNASASYSHIINVAGWSSGEGSGGWPSQISVGAAGLAVRQATSATAWGAWKDISKPSWSDVSGKPAQATRWPTWSEVTSKPSTFAPSSHTHASNEVTRISDNSLASSAYIGSWGYGAIVMGASAANQGYPGAEYGALLSVRGRSDYGFQLYGTRTGGNRLYVRNSAGASSWGAGWEEVLHAGNWNNYAAPKTLYGSTVPSSLLPGQIFVLV